ncbi:MAG: ComF family protein [Candidatus Tyrphobacter sp.]
MWTRALEVLFPAQCGACSAIGSGFCERCASEARSFQEMRDDVRVRALGVYEGALRRAVLALKDGRRDVAQALGTRLARIADAHAALVPVPTTAVRRRVRGIDGVVEVARVAAQSGGCMLHVLRQGAGDAQRGRSRAQRLLARGRFICSQRLDGERLVLVDDVCTTGATLHDCASTLRAAGADVREAVVVAMAPNE